MKDAQGRVIYLGKAKNLRSRAGSYFQKTAENDKRICDWIGEVVDIDYLVTGAGAAEAAAPSSFTNENVTDARQWAIRRSRNGQSFNA